MTQASTISTTSTRAMMSAAQSLGVDTAKVLAQCGLPAETLSSARARLRASEVPMIWAGLMAASQEPALHLLAAEGLPFGAYPVIDYMAGSSSTVAQGMTRLSRYFALINSGVLLPVIHQNNLHGLGLDASAGHPAPSGIYAEYTFAITLLRFRGLCGGDLSPREIHIASPRPSYASRCDALFDCPLTYDAPYHRMLFTEASWRSPHQSADAGVCDALETHALRLLRQLPTERPLITAARRAIAAELADGPPRVKGIAKTLGVSSRTLQRRLRDVGISFRDILDQARKQRAMEHLADPEITLCEVAFLLGFSEQSTFQRAFRRWTGTTPGTWRSERIPSHSEAA